MLLHKPSGKTFTNLWKAARRLFNLCTNQETSLLPIYMCMLTQQELHKCINHQTLHDPLDFVYKCTIHVVMRNSQSVPPYWISLWYSCIQLRGASVMKFTASSPWQTTPTRDRYNVVVCLANSWTELTPTLDNQWPHNAHLVHTLSLI